MRYLFVLLVVMGTTVFAQEAPATPEKTELAALREQVAKQAALITQLQQQVPKRDPTEAIAAAITAGEAEIGAACKALKRKTIVLLTTTADGKLSRLAGCVER